jgi:hypothetical protein
VLDPKAGNQKEDWLHEENGTVNMKNKKNCGCLSKYMKPSIQGTKGSKGRNGWDAKPVYRITNPGRR